MFHRPCTNVAARGPPTRQKHKLTLMRANTCTQVRTHFRLLRHRIVRDAAGWVQSARSVGIEALARRTEAAVAELVQVLAAL